jgi:hypothetical protein
VARGARRIEDEKTRLTSVIGKPGLSTSVPIRRIRYQFDGNDRIIGRIAEYGTLTTLTEPLDTVSERC